MARGGLEVKGIDALAGKLKKNATLKDVKDTVRLNTAELHMNAKREAPVDTGFLKRAIKMNVSDGGFKGVVVSAAHYAPYVEYGTRYMYPRMHIRPAFYMQRIQFIHDMKRLMK
jgi:HK97 gp10 family phage protein